ncbi:MAG: iron-sulfur cluster repair di-iron protein [Paludibacter sp.]|nr:iron-sulfur cluster repair di-iron protein [Paludibacter sp.]
MTTITKEPEITIGEIVTADFRAAEIFKNAGIDFCCGGDKSLEQACREKKTDPATIKSQLQELEKTPITQAHKYNEWNIGFLADYIVNTHHNYVRKSLPDLVHYTKKIQLVHGDQHPELNEIAVLVENINAELLKHLQKEEEVLFPAIKEAIQTNLPETKAIIISEIERMKGEHEFAGGAMDKINVLTNNYQVPEDGCNSYMVTLKLLREFEDDLHTHVHLENNILYPKALALCE